MVPFRSLIILYLGKATRSYIAFWIAPPPMVIAAPFCRPSKTASVGTQATFRALAERDWTVRVGESMVISSGSTPSSLKKPFSWATQLGQ